MSGWDVVATLSELDDGEMKQIMVGDEPVGLYRVGEDVFALTDICTHEHAYLTEGDFEPEDYEVECPLHGGAFEIRTGLPAAVPVVVPIETYLVRIVGDEVQLAKKT